MLRVEQPSEENMHQPKYRDEVGNSNTVIVPKEISNQEEEEVKQSIEEVK
jgi:hypothetical protein